MVIGRSLGIASILLNEGIAAWVGDHRFHLNFQLSRLREAQAVPPLTNLLTNAGWNSHDRRSAYTASGLMVRYLIEQRGGLEWFWNLWNASIRGDPQQAPMLVYGMSWPEIDDAYRAHYRLRPLAAEPVSACVGMSLAMQSPTPSPGTTIPDEAPSLTVGITYTLPPALVSGTQEALITVSWFSTAVTVDGRSIPLGFARVLDIGTGTHKVTATGMAHDGGTAIAAQSASPTEAPTVDVVVATLLVVEANRPVLALATYSSGFERCTSAG